MTFEEALSSIDDRVFANIGRRLTKVEKLVLKAAWEDEGYEKVAHESEYECNYLRGQVAPKLWMLLSPIIGGGTKITKKKLRAILEDAVVEPQLLNGQENAISFALSIEAQERSPIPMTQNAQKQPLDISAFYGRETEIRELRQLIAANRVLVIYGTSGIGKSALAAKLSEELETESQQPFSYVVWQSVYYAPLLDSLLADLLEALPLEAAQNAEQKFLDVQDKTSLLIDFLKKNRCLLILDGAEGWLQGDRNKSLNIYGNKYSEYGIFFRRIVEEKHCSCLLVTSQEPLKDVIKLQRSGRPSYSLKIGGLDSQAAKNILRQQGLTDEPQWEKLLEHYLGNPSVIKQVASRIDNFFGGEVTRFLNYKTTLGSELYRETLSQQCQPGRLTSLEKRILLYLVEKTVDTPSDTPVVNTFTQLVDDMQARIGNTVSLSSIIEAVENLTDRSLIVVSKDKKDLLLSLPVWIEDYVIKRKCVKLLNKGSQQERDKLLSRAYHLFNPSQPLENFSV